MKPCSPYEHYYASKIFLYHAKNFLNKKRLVQNFFWILSDSSPNLYTDIIKIEKLLNNYREPVIRLLGQEQIDA